MRTEIANLTGCINNTLMCSHVFLAADTQPSCTSLSFGPKGTSPRCEPTHMPVLACTVPVPPHELGTSNLYMMADDV